MNQRDRDVVKKMYCTKSSFEFISISSAIRRQSVVVFVCINNKVGLLYLHICV